MLVMLLDLFASLDTPRDLAADGALFWIGITLIYAFVARIVRSESLLRLEIIKQRFEPLQLLPISALRRAWLWCAPITVPSLLICALALPALLWGLISGLFTLGDAVGLTFFALMLSWGRPLWRPRVWRGQLDKNSVGINNRSDGFRAPDVGSAALWKWGISGVLVAAALGFAGVGDTLLWNYWRGLPQDVAGIADELWMTWPLFAARWLVRAQPFFGFHLAPMILVLPLWLARAHKGVARLAAVTAAEPFWTRALKSRWRRAQRAQLLAGALLIFGLIWPGSIEFAWMGAWFQNLAATRESALAAWWIAALALATLGATASWGGALGDGNATIATSIERARRAARRNFGGALAALAGAHVLGWAWPFGALWLQIAPASLAVAAVFFGAYAATWAGMQLPARGEAFRTFNRLWLYGGLACYFVFDVLNINVAQWQPLPSLLSPWTLWLTLRDPKIGANSAFWSAIALHLALVAVSARIVWSARQMSPQISAAPDDITWVKTTVAEAIEAYDKPQSAPAEAQLPVVKPIAKPQFESEIENADEPVVGNSARALVTRPPLEEPGRQLKRLLDWLARFDNPLLQLETRRVVGNALAGTISSAWLANSAVALVLLVGLPVVGLSNGAFPSGHLTLVLCLILLVWFVVPLLGIEGASRAYDQDRLDGSLQALFLTPRTDAEIVAGKLGPYLARGALMLSLFAPAWLLGLACCAFLGEPLVTAAFGAMPFFAVGFAVRLALASHWMALAKRRIGPGGTPAALVLGATLALPLEASAIVLAANQNALALFGVALGLSCGFALQAWGFWSLGLGALGRWRARDIPVAQ